MVTHPEVIAFTNRRKLEEVAIEYVGTLAEFVFKKIGTMITVVQYVNIFLVLITAVII